MRLFEFYFHATGNLRRGNPAREAGFSGFGAALCWELCPRCRRLPAARKSRLTFRQAGAGGMAEPCRPAAAHRPVRSRRKCRRPQAGQDKRKDCQARRFPRLAGQPCSPFGSEVTGVEPFRFYCARRSRKPEGNPAAKRSEARVGPRKRQAHRLWNPTPWSALKLAEPWATASGKPEGTQRRSAR